MSKPIITELSSGLRVATESMPHLQTATIAISVGAGARYENANENGISHLLEHMAFKGTPTRSARALAEEFDMIGGQSNAYTAMETTVYHARVLKDDIAQGLDILSDILQHSLFDPKELAREREVIVQEIAMHHDTPDDLIFDYFDLVAFPDQPVGRPIMGTAKLVSGYQREDLISYMKRHYLPQRMVVSAAGAVDHDAFVAEVEKKLTGLNTGTAQKPQSASYQGGEAYREKDLEQLHLVLGLPAWSIHDPDYYALNVFSSILGGGLSSRLFQEVREKRGLAYTVYSHATSYSDCGMLSIYTASGTEKKEDLAFILCDEVKKMAGEIRENEIRRAKNQIKAEALMARENSASIATALARHLLHYGRVMPLSEILEYIEAVDEAALHRVATRLLANKPTIAGLGPVSGLPDYERVASRLRA